MHKSLGTGLSLSPVLYNFQRESLGTRLWNVMFKNKDCHSINANTHTFTDLVFIEKSLLHLLQALSDVIHFTLKELLCPLRSLHKQERERHLHYNYHYLCELYYLGCCPRFLYNCTIIFYLCFTYLPTNRVPSYIPYSRVVKRIHLYFYRKEMGA